MAESNAAVKLNPARTGLGRVAIAGTNLRGSKNPSPYKEIGGSGTRVYAGFVESFELDASLAGQNRYKTIREMVTNTSIVAAGVRYFLNLLAQPKWTVQMADGSKNAEYTDLAERALNECKTSWYRIVRKAGLYIFHGFGIQEWTARRADDGTILFDDIEARPQHTIEQWDVDDQGTVQGVVQRPAVGIPCYLPREKILYLVDDALTDSPEGLGIFRNLIPVSQTMKRYRDLQRMGFERDLRGIPVGRAPFAMLKQQLDAKQIEQADYDATLKGLRSFVKMQAKGNATGLIMDSDPYEGMTDAGQQPTQAKKWDIDLLTGTPGTASELAMALDKLTQDMARIIGIEGMLLGASHSGGSFALSRDKSFSLYLNVQSVLQCIVEAVDRDILGPIWMLNGFDEKDKPKCKTEDVAFKDVAQVTAALREMATAGAVLAPDDPAINEVRHILGIPEATPYDATQARLDAQTQADLTIMDQQAQHDQQQQQQAQDHQRQMGQQQQPKPGSKQ